MTSRYRSLWVDETESRLAKHAAATLIGDHRADVCIVGGGFVGLWTALELKSRSPGLEVVLIEAERCGYGASGRNGGFVISWWSKLATLAKLTGIDEALRLASASARVPAEIAAFCAEHGVDARLQRNGWLWAASSVAQLDAWSSVLELAATHGETPFDELSASDARRRAGSERVRGGVHERVCATVQPALLATGMSRVARAAGVRVFERSPMLSLRTDGRAEVRCSRGTVTADRLVLSLGAWTTHHLRDLSRSLLVVASDMVATPVATERLDEVGLERGLAISDSRLLVNYFHRTSDDRIAFGSAGGALAFGSRVRSRYTGESARVRHVASNLHAFYPSLSDLPLASWTGPVDRSHAGVPFVVRRGRLLAAAGFSGNGVGPSKVIARILASLALESDDEWSASGLISDRIGQFPPEPFRSVGGVLVRRAVRRKEVADDRGKWAGWLTRKLAALAPPGLVPTRNRNS